jgi:DNA-binding HxlR family transcriptional regulator
MVERSSFRDMNCSIAQSLEIVGEWWSLLIVRDALLGVTRFDDFQERLGISRNILNRRLQRLVDEGVLERVAYQDHPPRYDYVLTEKGRDLWKVLTAMREWGDRWAAPDGPPSLLLHRACGEHVEIVPTCTHCGTSVTGREVKVARGPGAVDDSMIRVPRRTATATAAR